MKSERPSLAWLMMTVWIVFLCGVAVAVSYFLGDLIYKLIGG